MKATESDQRETLTPAVGDRSPESESVSEVAGGLLELTPVGVSVAEVEQRLGLALDVAEPLILRLCVAVEGDRLLQGVAEVLELPVADVGRGERSERLSRLASSAARSV